MAHVIGLHFVCRDDRNVIDHGDGTFDTGFWYVSQRHADTAEYLALHDSRAQRSYRQGRVLDWWTTPYEGKTRIVFRVREDGVRREWCGGGTGERGYRWSSD